MVEPVAPPAAMLTEVKRQDDDGSGVAAAALPGVADAAHLRAGRCRARLCRLGAVGRQELAALQASRLRHADRAGRLGVSGIGALGSAFQIVATARPGHTVAELQKVIDEELDRLRTRSRRRRARWSGRINQIEASFYRRMERVGGFGGKADQLNAYFSVAGDPDYFAEDLARYTSLTASDVQAAVVNWLPTRPARRARRRTGGKEMIARLVTVLVW